MKLSCSGIWLTAGSLELSRVSGTSGNDVAALLKLYEMATAPSMRDAETWVLTELQGVDYAEFQEFYPVGSRGWRQFTDICGLMELFGVLVKHGMVQEAVLFDLFGGIDVLWEAVVEIVTGMRSTGDTRLYENFETLYRRVKAWERS